MRMHDDNKDDEDEDDDEGDDDSDARYNYRSMIIVHKEQPPR